ncbi:crossover junction endonuclease EME1 isoform X1 [Amphiprion ocellaris]|uniref:ERCC4 domain-containing protein n=1 Tax=Amphiprion ocellaris TaxID=80972 RepID=A0A3Q1C1W6_AMPOC|nr:crossover junction endonuclease EME1 isoform X1 [Amphiprion ocellaris]XP_023122243.2 crossover junction endonuclease EME1 isoform X1 [Amphiprion ocellaris]
MATNSDSTSDLDEDLPVFDFLQPGRHLSQASQWPAEKPNIVDVNDSDAEITAISSTPDAGACRAKADVMMISSNSDDDEPYVPLAKRLKQRPWKVISASSAVVNEKEAENYSPSNLVSSQVFRQNGFSESECLLSLHQVRTVLPMTSGRTEDLPQLPLKPPSSGSSKGVSSAKKKLAKWTVEEIQAKREEALRRKQARERKQQDKEALRQEQDKQKAERNAAKALRPEECIKHMVVAIDPTILQLEGGGTLLESVQALGCSCAIEKQPLPRSVSWMRRTPCAQPGDAVCVPEAHVIMQMTVDDFITLVHSYVQEERHGMSDCGPTLTSWVQHQQRRNPGKTLSLVVIELEKFFRSQKSQNQKRFREAVQGEETRGGKVKRKRKSGGAELLSQVSQVEVEEAVVHLQLHTGVSVRFLSSWKGFSDHITMTTKAIAETPFKSARENTGFSFYLESEWAGGQRVDKAGKGLLQVWKRQIQQFNRVSQDMAATILAAYPSPQLLKKAYSLCRTEHEQVSLLSDLLIRRGEGITSTSRRVGPELSKRLFLMMNFPNPEQTLDSNL